MSAYKIFNSILFKDRECLLNALAALGFAEVEVAERMPKGLPLTLYGWHGDPRRERAEVVIRRKYIGASSNDVGFAWDSAQGAYVPIVSEYDDGRWLGGEWKTKLKVAYCEAAVQKLARQRRGRVVMDKTKGHVRTLKVRCYA